MKDLHGSDLITWSSRLNTHITETCGIYAGKPKQLQPEELPGLLQAEETTSLARQRSGVAYHVVATSMPVANTHVRPSSPGMCFKPDSLSRLVAKSDDTVLECRCQR